MVIDLKMMMKMKKNIIRLGLMVAAAIALTNCTKEIEGPADGQASAGIPFEITASTVETKTTNDGFNTAWKAGDKMSVFHVEAGLTALGANDQFAISAEDMESKVFKGTLSTALEAGKSYDWHAFYPYNDKFAAAKLNAGIIGYTNYGATCSSGAVSTGLKQDGNDSMNHLAGDKFPMYGTVSGLAADASVSVDMKHLMSVIELEVTNNASEAVTVTEVLFSAPVHIVGSFYYDIVNDEYEVSSESYCSKTAKLAVTNAQPIAKGGKAKFYLAVVPVSLEEGEITMTVTTDKGACVKTKTLVADNASDDLVFKAGKIRKMTFGYDAEVVVKKVSLPWTEDFSGDLDDYTLTDGGSTTKLFDEAHAGGTAPELLVSKGDGSLGVNVDLDGKSGFFTLSFKSNKKHVDVTTTTTDVTIENLLPEDVNRGLFVINIPENTSVLSLKLVNTSSGTNARIDDISLVEGKVELQSLAFKASGADDAETVTSISAVLGTPVSAPVLVGAKTSVTYSSSNASVATVNSSTGALTLVSAGQTIITATAAGSSQYIGASANYTLTVSPPLTGNEKYYVKVTEIPDDWSGKYLILYGNNALSGISSEIGLYTEVLVTDNGVLSTEVTNDYACEFIVTDSGINIKLGSSYLYAGNANKLYSKSELPTGDALNNYLWLISKGDAGWDINNKGQADRYLQWNNNSGQYRFACYKDTQKEIDLYKLQN